MFGVRAYSCGCVYMWSSEVDIGHLYSPSFKKIEKIFKFVMVVLPTCISVCHKHEVLTEDRRRHQFLGPGVRDDCDQPCGVEK